jgi:colanic acid biosynthesis glycosyl transferase WcaI
MKIGIISQWYPPEPWFIPENLATELAGRGHEVRVLTGFPNYPEGKIYPGFKQRWNDRTVRGQLTTRRVPVYPSHDSSALRRGVNYLSFSATSSLAALRYLAHVDVLYVYLTPATVFLAPALLRLLHGTPVVVHVQDLWPESVTASAMVPGGTTGKVVYRALHKTMRQIYKASASVVAIAPSMRELLVERGADPRKVRVVLNWTDEDLFRPIGPTERARREIGHRDRCTIMYAGNIGPYQDIEACVRAAAAVEHAGPVDLVFVGSGMEEPAARRLAAELGTRNVRFLGRRPPDAMAALLGAADYQLISLRDLPIFRGAIPSKLQAALSCGSPVVVSAPGDSADLVERSGAGLSCAPGNWEVLADRFLQAANLSPAERAAMARSARESYQKNMSKQAGVDHLEEILASAAREDRRR